MRRFDGLALIFFGVPVGSGIGVPVGSGDSDILIQVYVLDGAYHLHSFVEGALEGLATQDEAHTAGAFIDDGSEDGIGHIGSAFAFAAAVDEANATIVAIDQLVTREVDRVIVGMGQPGVDQRRGLAMFGGEIAAVIGW